MKTLIFLALFMLTAQFGAYASSSMIPVATTQSAPLAALVESDTPAQKLSLKEKMAMKLAQKLQKKAEKMAPQASFEDFVVLAAAVVVIIGIIMIISSPIHGLIVALVGLLIYLLGKSAGGSLNNIL